MSNKIKVNSSAISSVMYNEDTNVLSIEFVHGATYDYPSVPKEEFIKLVNAPSVGKYFNTHIRKYAVK